MRRGFCLALCLLTASSLFAQSKPASTETVYDKTLRSTVLVISPLGDNSGRASSGSGSYIGTVPKTNLPVIITNYHVVAPCVKENGKHAEVRVMFPVKNAKGEIEQNRQFYMSNSSDPVYTVRGKILAYLKDKDLALVELQLDPAKGQQLPRGVTNLPLAANSPRPSAKVHTIGNTGVGGMWSYTEGNVRSIYDKNISVMLSSRETLKISARMIECTNPTNKGDSGGPLVNDDAELVGVTQGGVVDANQLSTFIDIQEVKALLRQQKINVPTKRSTAIAQNSEKPEKKEEKTTVAKKDADKTTVDPREAAAEGKLRAARRAFKVLDLSLAESFAKDVLTDYPETKTVIEAKSLLEEIKKAKK